MTHTTKLNIIRDSHTYGPYTLAAAKQYFEQGLLFEHDLAHEVGSAMTSAQPLLTVLKNGSLKPSSAPIWKQFWDIVTHERVLLLPWERIFSTQWMKDQQVVGLMALGCVPFLFYVLPSNALCYFGFAAYFSVLWALFFFSVFKTPQANRRDAMTVFFQTPVIAMLVISVARVIPPFTALYYQADHGTLLFRIIGNFLSVGLIEEACKAAPVFMQARKPGRLLQPKTAMLYGMLSGLGFGIFEGIEYQLGVNRGQGVDQAYFLNVLRLTSLPFFHAIWAGISGYFIGFSMLHGSKRWPLRIIAIVFPATLHAFYNSFSSFVSFLIAACSVVLLMSYLSVGQLIHSSLKAHGTNNP
jgi:RsiW-degrading membrane proteinase PrsW (M82 family)